MNLRTSLHRRRRLAYGAFQRTVNWEFWPTWVMVTPLAPLMFRYGVKAGDLAAFTASNPVIPTGGMVGESKWDILEALRAVSPAHVPAAILLRADEPADERVTRALAFFADTPGPVVLKPDRGQRASGVVIARREAVVARYAREVAVDTIVQAYAPGEEFGVFYVRYPGAERGEVWSIGHKQPIYVTGDGRRSLGDLILDDDRAVCLAHVHFERLQTRLEEVPAEGDRVQLLEVGTHARGSVFVDAGHLKTAELEAAIDRISRGYDGFYFGRYDVRAAPEDLARGAFQIIELNGVGSEQAHVFDPQYGPFDYWRTMRKHWKAAYAIGAENARQGAETTPLLALWQTLKDYRASDAPHHPGESFADET
ncbi:MAG: hypothetical protein EP330_07860 [Deltaproteobacteria bacterium]|nr:MAG: hypothetical protein EP330_07860 [Deltaproteobacteria bacterium]